MEPEFLESLLRQDFDALMKRIWRCRRLHECHFVERLVDLVFLAVDEHF